MLYPRKNNFDGGAEKIFSNFVSGDLLPASFPERAFLLLERKGLQTKNPLLERILCEFPA